MQPVTEQTDNIKSAKYISWIIALSIISIGLSGQIAYWMPEFSNMDQLHYRNMALAAPELNFDTIQPFVYRILAPWLAGIIPINLELSFYFINLFALIGLALLMYKFLVEFKLEQRTAFALTSCFVFNRYFFQFLAWDYFQIVDSLSLIIIIYSFFLIKSKNWLALSFFLIIGVLIKETVLIIIPTAYAYLYWNKSSRNDYIQLTMASFSSIIVFILPRVLIHPAGGEDIITQLTTGIPRFFTFEAIIKKFIIAFTPFGLVPFFFNKTLKEFILRYKYVVVYFGLVVFVSAFGDFERLMAPFAPFYLLFLGEVIQKFLKEKDNKAGLKTFLLYMMAISFVASLHHIWGLFPLPGRNSTLVLTIAALGVMLAHFLDLKYPSLKFLKFWSKN
jgi:hypothetical protein